MSNSQPADARAALMTAVLLRHSPASAYSKSPSRFLRRPSRNFNAQDLPGHPNQAASSSKGKRRKSKSPFAIRGRTIYNAQDKLVAFSSSKTSKVRKPKNVTRHYHNTVHIACAPSEESRGKDVGDLFLMEARGDFAQESGRDDEDMSGWMVDEGSHGLTAECNEGSQTGWNLGEGNLEAMFEMFIKEDECLEDGMRF